MKNYRFSKLIVATIILFNILFTAVILWIFYQTRVEPYVLIGAWFAFTTGELALLSSQKKKEEETRREELKNDHLVG